jgi:hypothetical protein
VYIGRDKKTGKLLQWYKGGAEIGKTLIAQEGFDPINHSANRIKPQHHTRTPIPVVLAIGFQEGAVVMSHTPVAGI